MMLENLPDRSKKRDRDDVFGPSLLTSQKCVNYNKDQPQSHAKHHTPSKASAETTATTAPKPTMAIGPKDCPDCKPGETNGRCPKHKKHNNPGRNKRKREAKERLLKNPFKDLSKPVIDEHSFEHRDNNISTTQQQEYRMARSISPEGGVAIDEETLAKLRSHHHSTLGCDGDSSGDGLSHDDSHDDRSP
ncbi:unnamed protein product [Aureobasidium mustum]|uniref:Uncharacterized protein n=1 Tax=Aureobasidium mustum TaxID=2773714 RepID=A0A9N8KBJ0_9PEZI|nr:unnamed protein product [Aureobasidium mustum]